MPIKRRINHKREPRGIGGCLLRIPLRKKMDDTINGGCITDSTYFQIHIKKDIQIFHFNGEFFSVGKVINEGLDLGHIFNKTFKTVHVLLTPVKLKKRFKLSQLIYLKK